MQGGSAQSTVSTTAWGKGKRCGVEASLEEEVQEQEDGGALAAIIRGRA